ncbi:phasin family protein [Methyloversatilis sp. NSM2]|uniref:phasin family protein n=1 Tax=Methyloversatilis sp. NSM2 TaxID=3134135 RepID=UPI00311803D8
MNTVFHIQETASADLPRRLVDILADGGERLLKLQAESVSSALTSQMRAIEPPQTVAEAMSALWQLPQLYGALLEEMAEHARQSYHILSQVQNELVDLACDSVVQQAPALTEALSSGNVLFADRRHRSVVINFPDRRGMIARSRSQSA